MDDGGRTQRTVSGVRADRAARAFEFVAGIAVGAFAGPVAYKSGERLWAFLALGAMAGAASMATYNRMARTYALGFLEGLALLTLGGLLFLLLVVVPNAGGT